MPVNAKVRFPFAQAHKVAEELASIIRTLPVDDVRIVGSIRRGKTEIGDIDLLVVTDWSARDLLEQAGCEVDNGQDRRAIGSYKGIPVNLWTTTPDSLGAGLFAFTGPQKYVVAYRVKAKLKGLTLNEYGLWRGKEQIAGATENSIFEALGKIYKVPAERGR
jgi:DNA polymerase (family X)